MSTEKIKRKTREKAINTAFYFSEAFFEGPISRVSMNDVAAKLLGVKNEDDVAVIYKEVGINSNAFGFGPSVLRLDISLAGKGMQSLEELTPTYISWLHDAVQTVSACLDFYGVCLRIIRKESEKSAVANICDMLFYASKVSHQLFEQTSRKYSSMVGNGRRKDATNSDFGLLPQFPLISFWDDFQKEHEKTLQKRYGFTYHQASADTKYLYHYWNNKNAGPELRKILKKYAADSGDPNAASIVKMDACALAEKYLNLLDKVTNNRLSNHVRLVIDSVSGETKLISDNIEAALYLWLLTQIQNTEDYCICEMCGRLFKLGSQKTRTHCLLHNDFAINYFNSKKNKLKKKEAEPEVQNEDPHFEVVWRRNAPEITVDSEEETAAADECC